MKHYFTGLWLLLFGSLCATPALAADITFNLNLQYQIQQGKFTPGTDQAVVLGSFSGAGVALSDPDGDQIYSGTVTGQTADALLTYNYRFAHGGATVSETVAARRYVVQPTTAANVLSDWYNDQLPPYPYARFYASSVKTIPGEVVRFTEASEGGAATGWSWTFQGGNPAASAAQNPTCTWSAPGTYAVTLKASNASGSTTTKTLTVTVTTVDNALGWWNDAVFYQIYPRSFFDTNGNGTGDLQGMIQKLDYLNDGNAATTTDLGVTALYIMPVSEASEAYYGGYEVKDYKSIIGELGTQADFDQFVAAAHQRGMKVILDMVFNHSSDEHPWFQSAAQGAGGKYDDYYVFRSDNPGSAWRTNSIGHANANFNNYWGKFGAKTPDLNYNSRSVRNTVKDITSFWQGKNLDGFRLDAPMFLYERGAALNLGDQQNLPATYAYWQSWRDHLKAGSASAFSVGETWLLQNVKAAAKYTYQGFDIGFQFDIAYGVQDALNNESKASLQVPVDSSMYYYPFLQFGTFVSNHDLYKLNSGDYKALRLKSRLNNNQDAKCKVAAAWLLTAPGVPFVYYGDEVGGGGNNAYARDPMRWNNTANGGFTTGTPWEPAGDYATYNVASEQNDPNSFLSLYKNLISVRKAQAALRRGGYKTVSTSSNGVYAYARTYGSETIFVVLNLAASAQSNVALSVSGTAIPNGTYGLNNLLNAAQTAAQVTVSGGNITGWVPYSSLPANAFYVLKLNNTTGGPNSAPTIDAVAAQTLNLENGPQNVALSGISDGDYCSQTVSVAASSSATGVVSAPAVTYTSCNATGTLRLTPAAAGTSTITLTVSDNGGTANGGVNSKTISFTATVTDLPKAPTGLTLAQASPTSATLGWADNSTRETSYKIYWSSAATRPATPNATLAANATGYTATGLSAQTTYYFWVEAANANGNSADLTGTLALTLPNLALNKAASASNVETYNGVTYTAALAVDGVDNDFNSRWSAPVTSAGATQAEWLKIDLGASYNLSRVTVSWENANADSYYIMASGSNVAPDPANAAWAKVNITGKPNQSRLDDQPVAITGRYLAIYAYHKLQAYGYSIYELQAYGQPATGNQAPTASAGPNQTLAAGTTSTTLDASASTDPEGSALTYSWTKVSGPAATFSSPTAAKPIVSGLTNGSTYVFQVAVSDGALSSTAQVTVAVNAPATASTAYYIINRWKGTYLYDNNQQAAYAAAPAGTAYQWTLEAVSGNQRIRNVATGRYLNVENRLSYVESTSVPDSYTSGQWVLEPYAGYTRIRNVWQGTYVNVENQAGTAQCTAVDATYYSGHWTFQAVSGARVGTALAAAGPAAPAALSAYPNPVGQGGLTVLLPGSAPTARLRLLDGQGRVVFDQLLPVAGGQVQLPTQGLATGLYLLQALTEGTTYTTKLVME